MTPLSFAAMRTFHRLFQAHPASVNETYWQHLGSASRFSLAMILGGLACLVHGVLPFLFVKTGSQTIAGLHDRMIVHRARPPRQMATGPAD